MNVTSGDEDNPARPRSTLRDGLFELMTVDEVAAVLKVSRSWVYEHTRGRATPKTDRLPFVKVGKYIRFSPVDVRAFLDRRSRRS